MRGALIIFTMFTMSSCAIVGLGDYRRSCEKALDNLKSDERLLVEVGFANVITTDWGAMEFRNGSVGDAATYRLSKSNLLQKLYQEKSVVNISHTNESRLQRGITSYSSKKDETIFIRSERMVSLYCGGRVYGIVNRSDFQ